MIWLRIRKCGRKNYSFFNSLDEIKLNEKLTTKTEEYFWRGDDVPSLSYFLKTNTNCSDDNRSMPLNLLTSGVFCGDDEEAIVKSQIMKFNFSISKFFFLYAEVTRATKSSLWV